MIKNRLLVLAGLMLTLSLSAPKNVFCAAGAGSGSGASAMPLYTSTVGASSGAGAGAGSAGWVNAPMPIYTSPAGAAAPAGAGDKGPQAKADLELELRVIKRIWNNMSYSNYLSSANRGGYWGVVKTVPLNEYIDYKMALLRDNHGLDIKEITDLNPDNARDCITDLEALRGKVIKHLVEISKDKYASIKTMYEKEEINRDLLTVELERYLRQIDTNIELLRPVASAPIVYTRRAPEEGAGAADGTATQELVDVDAARTTKLDSLFADIDAKWVIGHIPFEIHRYTKADYFKRESYTPDEWITSFTNYCWQMHELINRKTRFPDEQKTVLDEQKPLLIEAYNNINNMPELEAGIEMLEHILRRLGCSFSQRVKPSVQELAAATKSIENAIYVERELVGNTKFTAQDYADGLFETDLAIAIKGVTEQPDDEIGINTLRRQLVKLHALRLKPHNCTITADQQAQINSAYDLLMRSIRSLRK